MSKNILVTRRVHPEAIRLLKNVGLQVKYFNHNRPLDKDILFKILPAFDAVFSCVTDKLTAEVLANAPNLKAISNMAVGLDNIDLDFAKKNGIQVFNTPDVVTASTADMTLALAFASMRKIIPAHSFVKEGKWKGWDPEIFIGRTFSALSWGIIGFGKIGKAVAKRLTGFDIKVFYYDPVEESDAYHAIKADLTTILKHSDIISLHLPLTQQTRYFFNHEKFSLMLSSALFINMARGGVVNQTDLIKALRENVIAGAALDVFEPEPIPADHEILKFNNVLFSPHIGTATQECRKEMAIMAAENLQKFFS